MTASGPSARVRLEQADYMILPFVRRDEITRASPAEGQAAAVVTLTRLTIVLRTCSFHSSGVRPGRSPRGRRPHPAAGRPGRTPRVTNGRVTNGRHVGM